MREHFGRTRRIDDSHGWSVLRPCYTRRKSARLSARTAFPRRLVAQRVTLVSFTRAIADFERNSP